MSEVVVTVEDPERLRGPQEVVVGVVEITMTEDINDATVVLVEKTSIRHAYSLTGPSIQQQTLYEGKLSVGETYRFPFELTLSAGPSTFDGRLVHLKRKLVAGCQVSTFRWLEGGVELPFKDDLSQPFDSTIKEPFGPRFRGGFLIEEGGGHGGCMYPPMAVFVGLPPFVIAIWAATHADTFELMMVSLFFPVPTTLFVIGMLWHGYRMLITERAIGFVQAEVEPVVVAGEPMDVIIHFTPPSTRKLKKLELTLVGEETIYVRSGERSTKETQVFFEEVFFSEPLQLEAGKEQLFGDQVLIPADVPSSFDDGSRVRWSVKVHCAMALYPDWKGEFVFAVRA